VCADGGGRSAQRSHGGPPPARAAGLFCVLASAVAVPMTLTDEEMARIASKVDEIDCSTD
jgi:hypothetical protein